MLEQFQTNYQQSVLLAFSVLIFTPRPYQDVGYAALCSMLPSSAGNSLWRCQGLTPFAQPGAVPMGIERCLTAGLCRRLSTSRGLAAVVTRNLVTGPLTTLCSPHQLMGSGNPILASGDCLRRRHNLQASSHVSSLSPFRLQCLVACR